MAAERWRKDLLQQVSGVSPERIPAIINRCPKCKQLGLSFDAATYKVKCDKCGFEVVLKT